MRTLEVFVSAECAASEAAQRVAAEVTRDAPGLLVRVVDIADEPASVPAAVVAVPTYVLDGRVVHLGNPSPAWRREFLSRL